MTRPVAVYSPRNRTVTIIHGDDIFALIEDDVLDAADRLDLSADMAEIFGHDGTVRTRIAPDRFLTIPLADARQLAQGIREAFAIPAKVAALIAPMTDGTAA